MSDALLTEISKKLSDIHNALKGSSGGSPGAKTPPGTVAGPDAAAAAKVAADKAAKARAAAADKTAKAGPPDSTKAPGGKHTLGQVRAIIRQVVDNKSLGFASAKEVLLDDGGGAQKVPDVKPELYDNVFEACQVLLSSEGAAGNTAAPEDDLM
jgi:hypothetical protein